MKDKVKTKQTCPKCCQLEVKFQRVPKTSGIIVEGSSHLSWSPSDQDPQDSALLFLGVVSLKVHYNTFLAVNGGSSNYQILPGSISRLFCYLVADCERRPRALLSVVAG